MTDIEGFRCDSYMYPNSLDRCPYWAIYLVKVHVEPEKDFPKNYQIELRCHQCAMMLQDNYEKDPKSTFRRDFYEIGGHLVKVNPERFRVK